MLDKLKFGSKQEVDYQKLNKMNVMELNNKINDFELREQQEKALAKVQKPLLNGVKYIILEAPPGVGKSLLAQLFMKLYHDSVNKKALRRILSIPACYKIDSLIACGVPDEKPLLVERSDTVRYWLDASQRLHVPKRPIEEILHFNTIDD